MGPLGERELPVQREVRLGGPGSLRGFRAASFIGDAGIQGQTEVRLPLPVTDEIAIVFLSWHVVGFLDAGMVAVDDNWDTLHADAGVGVSGINILSYVGFFVAHRITDLGGPEDGPRFVVRLRRDF
jgi:hemolysin activation/secretion protein